MTNSIVAGRNAVKEALRSGSDINKIYVQDSINKNQVKELLEIDEADGLSLDLCNRIRAK